MTKNTLNIVRLYDCYVLSQNLNGGVNNELSLKIKKKLDKKITELKNSDGGFFGIFGSDETKEKEKGEKGKETKNSVIPSMVHGTIFEGVLNLVSDASQVVDFEKLNLNQKETENLANQIKKAGGLEAYLIKNLGLKQNKDITEDKYNKLFDQNYQLFKKMGFK